MTKNIADIYVSILVIYHLFIDSFLSEINRQHSMLAVYDKHRFPKVKKTINIANKYLSIFDHLQYFYHCCIYGDYSQHKIPASLSTFGTKMIQQKHDNNL